MLRNLRVLMALFRGDKVKDVTNDKAFWGGFEVGPIYETTCPLLFDGENLNDAIYWPLKASARRRVPFEQYQAAPANYPGVTVIPAGTHFTIIRLQTRENFKNSALELVAQFLDGPAANVQTELHGLIRVRDHNHFAYFPTAALNKSAPDLYVDNQQVS